MLAYVSYLYDSASQSNLYILQNVEVDDFDDFGIDLYPVPEATFSGEDLDTDKNVCTGSDQRNDALTRYSCFCGTFNYAGLLYLGQTYG